MHLTILTLLLLLLLPMPGVARSQAGDESTFGLYVGGGERPVYAPIDPLTLADLAQGESFAFDMSWPDIAISADGSTSVLIDPGGGSLDAWITVYDGLFGPVRLTIAVEEAVYGPRLSADGSRVSVTTSMMCGPSGCSERIMYTYDTATGVLVSQVAIPSMDPIWPELFDPSGKRLFVPFVDHFQSNPGPATPAAGGWSLGPWPLQIAAYDLDTGQEAHRLTVPGVFAGSWQAGSIDGMYVGETQQPGIALSPDGTRIAVVDTAMERLTLIDTATLTVVATHDIHETESLARRALRWLGIVPETAAAKVSQGRSLEASFSPDGSALFLTGYESTVDESVAVATDPFEAVEVEGYGVARVDVGSGEIVATALEGDDLDLVGTSPDGLWLYAFDIPARWWVDTQAPEIRLARLDATTLDVLAERTFAERPQVMIVPYASSQLGA